MRKYNLVLFIFLFFGENIFSQNVTCDFSSGSDYPLVKKFDFMNSGIVGLSRYQRDIDKFIDTKTKSMRIDLYWGNTGANGWSQEMITGKADSLVYNYNEIDALSMLLKDRNMGGYWSYCYVPIPLQSNGSYIEFNSVLDAHWQEVTYNFAKHFKEKKLRPEYQGIWNEPDYAILINNVWVPQFFKGSTTTFNRLYDLGVKGLRKGDPDATVGGPDLTGSNNGWLSPFLTFVSKYKLPIDFYSFHMLGGEIQSSVTFQKNELVKRGSYFDQTELIIGELNPICCNSSGYDGAISVLNTMDYLVGQPYLTRTYWAQGMDVGPSDKIAAIDYNGHKRALYFAHKFYAMMPVDRKKLEITASVKGFASSDEHQSCVLLWNSSGAPQNINLALNNIPFAKGTLKVHRIDGTHNSYNNLPSSEGIAPEITNDVTTAGLTWNGSIPNNGVVFIDVTDSTGISEDESVLFPATFVRKHYYFPNRNKLNYAEFDRTTWIARLGMANNDSASSITGVVAEDLPDSINVTVETEGNIQTIDNNSLLGIRLDFRVNDTTYSGSVLLHGGIYNASRTASFPFATKLSPDQTVQVNLNNFILVPSKYAPANWNGKVLITFIMENTGKNSRSKFKLRPVNTLYPYKIHHIPCTVEAEEFDNGGEGIAYHVTDQSSFNNTFRKTESIKIENCSDTLNGFDITKLQSNDWVKYSIYNDKKDDFILSARVSALLRNSKFHFELGKMNSTKIFEVDSVADQKWITVTDKMTIDSGTYILKLVIDQGSIRVNKFSFNKIIKPYSSLIHIPGIIEAEKFDVNGYYDADLGNIGGAYRPNEDVDITCTNNVCAVGWIQIGEWMQYSVHAYRSGIFQLQSYVSANSSSRKFQVLIDNIKVMDTIVPNKYSFDKFTAVCKNISLDTGNHIVKIYSVNGNFNIDKLVIDTVFLGIREFKYAELKNISIFPNPVQSELTVDFSKFTDEMPCTVSIADLTGRVILQENIYERKIYHLNLSKYEDGMYMFMVHSAKNDFVSKLLIQK